jgi:hypothetical protein
LTHALAAAFGAIFALLFRACCAPRIIFIYQSSAQSLTKYERQLNGEVIRFTEIEKESLIQK